MNKLKVIKKVKKVLDSPDKLCKGAYDRNYLGVQVGAGYNRQAYSYCLIGAVEKVVGWELINESFLKRNVVSEVFDAFSLSAQEKFGYNPKQFLTEFVDTLSYDQVIYLIDHSIEKANEHITN